MTPEEARDLLERWGQDDFSPVELPAFCFHTFPRPHRESHPLRETMMEELADLMTVHGFVSTKFCYFCLMDAWLQRHTEFWHHWRPILEAAYTQEENPCPKPLN